MVKLPGEGPTERTPLPDAEMVGLKTPMAMDYPQAGYEIRHL
jgi:hypothetical protein